MVQSVRGDEHEAVGIGVPSVVDFETGRVLSSVNVPMGDLPLRDVLAERLDARVYVDNDATVAAFAEAHDDQLRLVAGNLVMITIGTGIGGGLVLGGRIYRGRTGGAGELGHTLVGLDLAVTVAAPVGFPQPGSLERLTAGQALGRQAARAGDATAVRVIELWGERVGVGVANAINTFDPDEVVIGGYSPRAARSPRRRARSRVAGCHTLRT